MLTKKEILQNKIDFEKYDFAGIYFLTIILFMLVLQQV